MHRPLVVWLEEHFWGLLSFIAIISLRGSGSSLRAHLWCCNFFAARFTFFISSCCCWYCCSASVIFDWNFIFVILSVPRAAPSSTTSFSKWGSWCRTGCKINFPVHTPPTTEPLCNIIGAAAPARRYSLSTYSISDSCSSSTTEEPISQPTVPLSKATANNSMAAGRTPGEGLLPPPKGFLHSLFGRDYLKWPMGWLLHLTGIAVQLIKLARNGI